MAGVSFLYSFVSPLSIAGPQMIYFTFCQNSGVPPDLRTTFKLCMFDQSREASLSFNRESEKNGHLSNDKD